MQILKGRDKTLYSRNKKVAGILFPFTIVHGTANTDLANSDFDSTLVLVDVTLVRNGKRIPVVPSTPLKVLHMDSNFYRMGFEKANVSPSATIATVLVEKAVGVKEQWLYELSLIFHGPYVLEGGDVLETRVNFQDSSCSANVDATTKVDVYEILAEPDAVEEFTPSIEQYLLNSGDGSLKETYSNVYGAKVINLDKTSLLAASDLFTQIKVGADNLSFAITMDQLKTLRAQRFITTAQADMRLQSYDLNIKGLSVDLDLTYVVANINAGKNYLIIRRAYNSNRLMKRARAMRAQIQIQEISAAGGNVDTETIQSVNNTLAATATAATA